MPEKLCECGKLHTRNGKLCSKCSSKKYRQEHPSYQKEYRRNNLEERREYARERYRKNRKDISKRRKELRKLKPEQYHAMDKRGHESLSARFRFAIKRAKERDLAWLLTLEEYSQLIQQPCYYCNDLLKSKVTNAVGLDRIDNSIGYELTNVVSCCRSCNVIRNDVMTSEETKQVIQLLLKIRGLVS